MFTHHARWYSHRYVTSVCLQYTVSKVPHFSPSSGVTPHSSWLSLVPISKRNRRAPVLGLLLPSPLPATLQLNFGGWGDPQEGSAQPRGSPALCCCEETRCSQLCKHDCKRHRFHRWLAGLPVHESWGWHRSHSPRPIHSRASGMGTAGECPTPANCSAEDSELRAWFPGMLWSQKTG